MQLGALILKPSYSRLPSYQGCDLAGASGIFPCSECGTSIAVSFGSLLRRENVIDKAAQPRLFQLFEIPAVGKSHDGGWPVFDKVTCAGCEKSFFVYVGVNETSNSVYAFTLQGVVEEAA